MKGSGMSAYRRHILIQYLGGLLATCYILSTFFLTQEPFPFFDWNLFSRSGNHAERYEIMITSLDRGVVLKQPLSLADLKPEYRQDWLLNPTKIVHRFGGLVAAHAPAQSIAMARKLVENYLLEYPYVEYQLVRIRYDPVRYVTDNSILSSQVLGTFRKEAAQTP